jgi:hypothetical protein
MFPVSEKYHVDKDVDGIQLYTIFARYKITKHNFRVFI